MSYLVMARKWRPQSWTDLVSQDHVAATLKNAILHNRLAHAYLFTGPRGVGKTSAARILAKALNCEQGKKPDPCNACTSCSEITESRSIDVLEIDGASTRGIDDVRNLRDNIQYTPARGQYKVYIIDEVHMLTTQAFNALLKTLEEPPSHVVFVFATTEPHRVPATIVSRCQRFDFRRIGVHDMVEHLKHIVLDEKIEIDEEALLLIARKADGSMRDSQSILDQLVSFSKGRIGVKDVVSGLGLIGQEIFFELTDALIAQDLDAGLTLIDKVISGGYDCEEFLFGLMDHFRNILVVRALKSTDMVEVSQEHKERYKKTAEQFEEEDIIRLIQVVSRTRYSLKNSLNPRLPLELAMIKMIKLDKTVKIDDLLAQLSMLHAEGDQALSGRMGNDPQKRSDTGASGSKKSTESPAHEKHRETGPDKPDNPDQNPGHNPHDDAAVPESNTGDGLKDKSTGQVTGITFEIVKKGWDTFIQKLKAKKVTVGSFIQEGELTGLNQQTVEISFGLSCGFNIDRVMKSKSMVEEALEEVFGTPLHLRCIKTDMPRKEIPDTKAQKAKDLKEIEDKNPELKKMIEDFEAEIVE